MRVNRESETILVCQQVDMNRERRSMNPNARKVSVVIPSYNHERYLIHAVESVFRQTYTDYEVLILDDASTDHSVERARAFITQHASRPIRLICHEKNQGGVLTLNELIEAATGEYIALINSDDLWLPEKLEKQVAFLDEHPEVGAVFTQAEIIDENGKVLSNTIAFAHDIFLQKNRSRGKWLHKLFFELNCLCHPSILIRRSIYTQIGLYDPRLHQLPDMQMWVRLLKHTGIHIIEAPLVQLRSHAANTSLVNAKSAKRNLNELSYLLDEFFDGMPDEVLIDGFGDLFRYKGASTATELECEKAFLFLTPKFSFKSLYFHIGLQKLYRLLGSPEICQVLLETYHFDYRAFIRENGEKFFDEYLLASIDRSAEGSSASLAEGGLTSWGYWFAMNKHFLALNLRKFPFIYNPLLKSWQWLRGRLH